MTREPRSDLPPELRQVLARAGASVAAAPAHNLSPVYRRVIYAMMGHTDPRSPRGWLALITARQVDGLWQQPAGRRLLAGDPLATIEGVLRGRIPLFAGRKAAQEAWQTLGAGETAEPDPRAFDAAHAVLQALREVLGADPFHDVSLRNTQADEDLAPWSSDTARWAAAAYSGRLGAETSDARRRGEFWHWWLYDAVPEAWFSSGQLPAHDAVLRARIW